MARPQVGALPANPSASAPGDAVSAGASGDNAALASHRHAREDAPINESIGAVWSTLGTGGLVWPAANTACLGSFQVFRAVTVTTAHFRVITQNGNMDVGIYNNSGTRLGSTGTFAVPAAANTNSRALSAGVALVPGVKYWAAIASDSATASFFAHSGAGIMPDAGAGFTRHGNVASSFVLPSTIVIPTAHPTSNVRLYCVFFS